MYSVTVFSGTVDRSCHPLPFRSLLCILIILVLALAAPASAAVHTLNPGDSIQTAIDSAGSGDTIVLNPGIYNQHDISIDKNIIIKANMSAGGSAADTIIDATSSGRIFNNGMGGYNLTIDNLTLQNGKAIGGGGINSEYSSGRPTTIIVTSSTFFNCSVTYEGGAIFANYATINVTSSTFSNCSSTIGNGGAIYSYNGGKLTITSSTFSNCWALYGSAIYSESDTATIHFSRLYNNTGTMIDSLGVIVDATNNWWGTNDDPSGFTSGTVTVSPWLVLNITATPSSVTTAQNSIIRTNLTNNSAGTDTTSGGFFVPDGIPVAFALTGGTGSVLPTAGNITSGANMTTFTPAGAGTSTVSATVDGETVSTDITVTTPAPTVHTLNPGDSIQQNITDASDGDTIILNPGIYYQYDITVSKDITIQANTSAGSSAANTIIDASGAGRIFYNSGAYSLAIDNLTLRNGYTTLWGGAIYAYYGIVTVTSSSFSNCSATFSGGAIYADSSSVTITSSTFSNCSATVSGGAIYADYLSNVTIDLSTFSNCSALYGGAIYAYTGTVTVTSSSFSNCSATVSGGAIYAESATVTIHFSRFYNDTGTAVYNDGGTVDAADNWWGTNSDPSGSTYGGVTISPWLVVNITATPSTINTAQTSAIRTNLTNNSAGTDTTSGGIFVPDGIPVAFALTGGTGSVLPQAGNITSGANTTTFTPAGSGTSTIAATVDGQTVSTDIMVTGLTAASKVGVFRNGGWYLDYSGNGWWDGPVTDRKYPAFGTTGDAPVAGDWNNNGISETGVFRNGAWYLDFSGNGWWDGPVTDLKYPAFGTTGDLPVAGNWSGDGTTEIGVFRNGAWFLDSSGNGWWDGPVTDIKYPAFGTTGDLPVAGDWNNDGIAEIGVFRNGAWFLDSSGNGWWDGPVTDLKYPAFGTIGDLPVTGDWNGDKISEIGVFRNGAWYLDYNGNGWWDGPVTDLKYPAFGTTGDKPVAGIW